MMDDGLPADEGLPGTSYPSLIAFLAGAFVFQENTPQNNKLCVSDHVPSRGFVFQENTSLKIPRVPNFVFGNFIFGQGEV